MTTAICIVLIMVSAWVAWRHNVTVLVYWAIKVAVQSLRLAASVTVHSAYLLVVHEAKEIKMLLIVRSSVAFLICKYILLLSAYDAGYTWPIIAFRT